MAEISEARLPRSVRPVRYDLTIEPDLSSSVFTGRVAITVTVDEPTRDIVLNARDLDLGDARVVQGHTTIAANPTIDATDERASFRLDTEVQPGDAVIECTFTGKLHDDLVGFYRSRYVDADGNERTIAATQ